MQGVMHWGLKEVLADMSCTQLQLLGHDQEGKIQTWKCSVCHTYEANRARITAKKEATTYTSLQSKESFVFSFQFDYKRLFHL